MNHPSEALAATGPRADAAPAPMMTRVIAACIGLAACVLLLGKVALTRRININWDEFNFLSHVHELTRGELTLLLQGAYTHLFAWLVRIGDDEIAQILAARTVMAALLILTAFLIWKLAARWLGSVAALIAPLCYLSMSPIIKHGASFRYDSLMAPLLVAALLFLTSSATQIRRGIAVGLCLGASAAVSVKAALSIPLVGALLVVVELQRSQPQPIRRILMLAATSGAVAVGTALLLVSLHSLSLAETSHHATEYVAGTAQKTLLDVPFFPRASVYYETRYEDRLAWWLIYGGLIAALLQRRYWQTATLALSLTPILFYRNAFPYYYVVMLAPACVLAGVAAETLTGIAARHAKAVLAYSLVAALGFGLFVKGILQGMQLHHDQIRHQHAVVAAVHQIFPDPVPYIDHSGMISSFPKINFFMSSWGLSDYRDRRAGFMKPAMSRHQPPLLLANRPVLDPASGASSWLLPEDRQLIEQFYLSYWGPIKVAGANIHPATTQTQVALPFPGRYRLESRSPLIVDGKLRSGNDVLQFTGSTVAVACAADQPCDSEARFIIAAARPAPSTDAPMGSLYSGL
ncbi:hypothetical protein HNQ60_003806 [Povalibacter uvarum]|uniref:Glycosyltransferase RgtA/B/C/D-like domain-containing protein n=1 Tax=Povalibacter uvarum TaxID=732238 RepID=A0A841HRH7_9GAMM|nr:glycosyltransferase family 39 protein [Povalibacter uvarum]MBB6094919.1 hypothetical protein [Povalibacter uvarum]